MQKITVYRLDNWQINCPHYLVDRGLSKLDSGFTINTKGKAYDFSTSVDGGTEIQCGLQLVLWIRDETDNFG